MINLTPSQQEPPTETTAWQPDLVLRALLWVCALVLLGAAILFYRLDARSFWWDEFNAVNNTHGSLSAVVQFAAGDVHPPLYFLMLWLWMRIFSSSEWATRGLSALLAVLSIPLLYGLGTRLVNRRTGGFAIVLLVTSPFFVLYARMVRYFSLVLLVGTLCSWLLLRSVKHPSKANWLAYTLAAIVLMYTHYLGAGLLISHGLYILTSRRKYWGAWLATMAGVFAAYLPWISITLQQFSAVHAAGPADLGSGYISYILKTAYAIYAFSVGETTFPWNPAAVIGLLTVAVLALIAIRGLFKAKRPTLAFLGINLLVTLAWTVAATSIATPTMPFIRSASYMFYAFPLFVFC